MSRSLINSNQAAIICRLFFSKIMYFVNIVDFPIRFHVSNRNEISKLNRRTVIGT